MIYELLTKQEIELGYKRFLEQHPLTEAQVDERTRQHAIILGVDQSNLRQIETATMLIEQAKVLGIDSFEYLLQFAIENIDRRQNIMQLRDELMTQDISCYRPPPKRIGKKPV